VVLVHVVNPQSFHWTMDLAAAHAAARGLLCAAVVAAGTVTAWLAGRSAAGQPRRGAGRQGRLVALCARRA
jgi:putative ABC transport system permease protein